MQNIQHDTKGNDALWRVMICDDEPDMCAAVQACLERFSQECGTRFSVQECHSGESLVCRMTSEIDLLLLDIGMDGMTGMEAARRLRAEKSDVCLIFITSMTQFAMEGYQVHAYGFLQKPINYASFRLLLLDTLRHLQQRQVQQVSMKIGGEVYTLNVTQVQYLEVRNHEVRIVQTEGEKTCYGSMNDMDELLKNKGFFRCHKSFCVNLRHVSRITQTTALLSNGEEIPVSKHRRREFLDAYTAYVGGSLL